MSILLLLKMFVSLLVLSAMLHVFGVMRFEIGAIIAIVLTMLMGTVLLAAHDKDNGH